MKWIMQNHEVLSRIIKYPKYMRKILVNVFIIIVCMSCDQKHPNIVLIVADDMGYGGDYFYHIEQDEIDLDDFTGAHNLAENGKEVFYDGQYMADLISEKAIDWLEHLDEKLFRIKEDPSELDDLLVTNPEKVNELKEKLKKWEKEVAAPRLRDFPTQD